MQVHQFHSPRQHTFTSAPTYTQRNDYSPSYTSSSTNASTNPTSVGSNSTSSPRITSSRLHKKVYTHQDPPIDERFFSPQASPYSPPQPTMPSTSTVTASATFPSIREKSSSPHFHAKAKIKPLLKLAKGQGRSSRNSIDLDQPGGGEAAKSLGLGIYGNGDGIYGYDAEIEPFPRHRRNVSGTSAGSGYSPAIPTGGYVNKNGQYIHPKRQIPRPYTPTPNASCHGSEDSEDDSYEDDVFSPNRGYASGEYSRKSSIDYSRSRVQPSLRLRTDSQLSSPMIRSATGHSIHSPISPASAMTTVNSTTLLRPSLLHNGTVSGATTRDPSPSFAASVTAARLAWDAKEASKEEKREKKRRKSEQKDREKMAADGTSISRATSRGRTGSGSIWEERTERVEPSQGEYSEKEESRGRSTTRAGQNVGTGKKWGVKNVGGREYERRSVGRGTAHPGGLKKRWLGFVVWIRIGLVKMGRKFQGIGKKRK